MANALSSCPEILIRGHFRGVRQPAPVGHRQVTARQPLSIGHLQRGCPETPCLRGLQRRWKILGVDSAALSSCPEIFYPWAFQRVSASPRQSGIARPLPGSPCQLGVSRGGAQKSFIHAGFRGGARKRPVYEGSRGGGEYLASIQPPCSCSRALAATRNSSTIGPLSSRPPPGT